MHPHPFASFVGARTRRTEQRGSGVPRSESARYRLNSGKYTSHFPSDDNSRLHVFSLVGGPVEDIFGYIRRPATLPAPPCPIRTTIGRDDALHAVCMSVIAAQPRPPPSQHAPLLVASFSRLSFPCCISAAANMQRRAALRSAYHGCGRSAPNLHFMMWWWLGLLGLGFLVGARFDLRRR